MAAASPSKAAIATLCLLLLSTLSTACDPCHPKPKPKPKPTCPPPPAVVPPPPSCPPPPAVVPPPPPPSCPRDTLKLGVCADLLGLVHVVVGSPASSPCCALLQGLADLEAALCLCTAIKANVLGINLDIPVTLSLLLSACEKSVPPGFQCG